jgi:hypothetical protein
MSSMLSKQQLAEILLQLLKRTAYHRRQMKKYVNRLFEPFKSDGVPYSNEVMKDLNRAFRKPSSRSVILIYPGI